MKKDNLIVFIVAIVAVVGIVTLVLSAGWKTGTMSAENIAGDAKAPNCGNPVGGWATDCYYFNDRMNEAESRGQVGYYNEMASCAARWGCPVW